MKIYRYLAIRLIEFVAMLVVLARCVAFEICLANQANLVANLVGMLLSLITVLLWGLYLIWFTRRIFNHFKN
jgi:hypothetical protein